MGRRAELFEIDYTHKLADKLVFASFGGKRCDRYMMDSTVFQNDMEAFYKRINWVHELGRYCTRHVDELTHVRHLNTAAFKVTDNFSGVLEIEQYKFGGQVNSSLNLFSAGILITF